jgi:isoleucyl-tRNA synthetase
MGNLTVHAGTYRFMTETKKTDYRDTVFLPKTDFPMRGNLPQQEPKLLLRWKAMGLYELLRKQAKGHEPFILHDGPPYANGNIHIGHALNKILKDIVVRSRQMLGFDAPYVPGWDCHGLPIEWKIEEEYRAKGQDKDQVPVLQFRAECRAFAEQWKNVQSEEFQRLGVLGDWPHPYTTMTKKAEAQILREMYKFLLNGLLYKGVKPVMWSVVEKTALAEAEIEYQDHTSTTLWVKFPIIKTGAVPLPLAGGVRGGLENTSPLSNSPPPSPPASGRGALMSSSGQGVEQLKDASIVIWTTTPWTIPANRAIAFGQDVTYTLLATKAFGNIVVAADRLSDFIRDAKISPEDYHEITILKGNWLAGTICAHPFRNRTGSDGYFDYDVPLYHGDFVTTEAGTGFVHIAPGHGEDDFNLGKKHGIKFDETVGDDGRYLPNVKGFAGLYVYKPDGKTGEANGQVIKALIEAGALLAKQNIKHPYPHSWRSKAPLIFRTTPQWFIAMDRVFAPAEAGATPGKSATLRELAMQAIGDTQWFPAMGENRIRGMIETRPDWCISRQRAWGVPIALFVNKSTGEVLKDKAVLDRVAQAFGEEGADAWYSRKPESFLGSAYKAADYAQVFDIVDVWFESGSTHAFCLDQKSGVSEWPNLRWPATLYLEGSDQHRGWFHSSLLESCGTLGRAPYEQVLTHGFILDEQGRKMSKSLGNVTAPQEVIDQLGADILRLWVVASDTSDDLRIGKEILKQTGDLYRRFRNTLRYLLGALDGFEESERLPVEPMLELERWVLHRLHEIDAVIRADMVKYDFNHLLTALHDFCNGDLSAFYFDIRKDSLYCDRADSPRRRAARTVMDHIFNHLVAWLAPFLCFTAEEAWLARHDNSAEPAPAEAGGSVHLLNFPEAPSAWRNEALGAKWAEIRNLRRVVTGAMELARNEKKIGSSLQAHPHIYLQLEHNELLEGLDISELSISSSSTVTVAEPPERAFILDDVSGIGVVIKIAEGQKCERCWQVLPEVGSHADHPDLCNRCHDAVTHQRKEAA